MSVIGPRVQSNEPNYLNVHHGVKSWLLTTDHKRTALLYLVSITLMFFLAGVLIALVRAHLLEPAGRLLDADTYNQLFTMHGIIMVFFFLIPSIPTVLGNFLLPLMLGARALAFPRLNLACWYLYLLGSALVIWAMISGVDTGWTFYAPYSLAPSQSAVVPAAIGILIAGFSAILTSLNFVVTTHRMRAPGLSWFRLPLFVWTLYAASIVKLLSAPALATAFFLLILERTLQIGYFDPDAGGDPMLFQHLFWFYAHPAVYITVLPGIGVISEVIPCFARTNIFGYQHIVLASFAIAALGFLTWGQHLFVAGQSVYAAVAFSALGFLVAVPCTITLFNWMATLYKGSIALHTPMLFALGFIGMFTIGTLSGLFLVTLSLRIHLNGTYFEIGRFHFALASCVVTAYLGGLHFWWPKITGRMYSERWGRLAALFICVGFILTFLPQFVAGYLGMPRRSHQYATDFQIYNVMSTAGTAVLAAGYVMPIVYLIASLAYGKSAGANPWQATGLEWQTPSPPLPDNFGLLPTVTGEPYQYIKGAESAS